MNKANQDIPERRGGLIGCLARLVRPTKPIEYTERIFLEDGTLIHSEAPYKFARLFKEGQEFVMLGKTMLVISCRVNGEHVDTVVSILSNTKSSNAAENQQPE